MKKYLLIVVIMFGLIGCSAEEPKNTEVTQTDEQIENESTESETSDEEITEVEETFYGESDAFAPYRTTVEYTKKGDDILTVDIREYEEDGTEKKAGSEAGTYGNPDYQAGSWHVQIGGLEQYIIANDQFPELDSTGKDVDEVSGATLNLSGMQEAYETAEIVE